MRFSAGICLIALAFGVYGLTYCAVDTVAPRIEEALTPIQLELFEEHGSVMMLVDPETSEIAYANRAASQFYGYSKAEMIGMKMDAINTLSFKEVQAEMKLAVEEKRNFFSFKHRVASGEVRSVEVYSYPILMQSGQKYLFSIIYDVTDKVQTSQQLMKSIQIVIVSTTLFSAIAVAFALLLMTQKRAMLKKHQSMRAMIDNMQEGFALFALQAKAGGEKGFFLKEINPSLCKMLGINRQDFIGRRASDILEDYGLRWRPIFEMVLRTGEAQTLTDLMINTSHHEQITVFRPENNAIALIATDLSKLIDMHLSMEIERSYYHHLLNALGQGIVALDHKDEIVMINHLALKLLHVDQEEIIGRRYIDVFTFERQQVQVYLDPLVDQVQQVHYDLELRSHDGRLMPMELNISPLVDAQGHRTGTIITFSDYSEMRTKEEEILYLSRHDQLTGLYNRHYFEDAMLRLDHPKNLPLSLVMIDVNGLKMTNDAFGHEMGDILLKTVGNHLKAVCRSEDIVARVGGDEFVLVLPRTDVQQLDRVKHALQIGEAGVEAIHVETDQGMRILLLSYAIGTVTKHMPQESTAELIRSAENEMYQNKLDTNLSVRRQMIETIMQQLFVLQPKEQEHSSRVGGLLKLWGEKMTLEPQFIEELELLGLVHDIGKIALSNHILQEEGPIESQNWALVKRHSESGFHILRSVEGYGAIAEAVLDHHERWDGAGYPRGIESNSIHWMGRMLSIADAFEAITADRPYRKRSTVEAALDELKRCSGTQFDPELIQRFMECFSLAELEVI